MLTQISTKGFKDGNFTQKLKGLDLFTSNSQNGCRKSSRLEVAKLLCLGHLPKAGKGNTLDDILSYTNKETMEVAGIFNAQSNGSSSAIKRIFSKNGGKKKQIIINGEDLNFTKGDAQIKEILGCQPLMVDITEFMQMSDNKKKEFLLRTSPEGISWTKDEVAFVLWARLLASKLQSGMLKGILTGSFDNKPLKDIKDDERERLLTILRGTIDDKQYSETVDKAVVSIFAKWDFAKDAQDNISLLIEHIKKERSLYDRKVKENKAGSRKIDQINQDMSEAVTSSISETKQTLADLQKSLTTIEKQLSTDEEKRKAVDISDGRIIELKNEISELLKKDYSGIEVKKKELSDLKSTKYLDEAELEKELETLFVDSKEKKSSRNELEGELFRLDARINTLKELQEPLERTKGKCGLNADIVCSVDMAPYIAKFKDKIDHFIHERNNKQMPCDHLKKEVSRIEAQIKANEAMARLNRSQKSITNVKIVRIESDLSRLRDDAKNTREALEKYKKELSLLEKESSNESGLVDPETLEIQKKGIEIKKKDKEKELGDLEQRKGLLLAEQQIKIDKLLDEVNLNIYKEAIKILGPSGLQGEIVESVKGPLEKEVNAILKELDENMEFAIDLSDGFRMGWKKEDAFIPMETINDAHGVLVIASFLTAIINRMNPPLRIIQIEAAELGMGLFLSLLKGLEIIKNKLNRLDNVLVAHHQTLKDDQVPPGWTQHILE